MTQPEYPEGDHNPQTLTRSHQPTASPPMNLYSFNSTTLHAASPPPPPDSTTTINAQPAAAPTRIPVRNESEPRTPPSTPPSSTTPSPSDYTPSPTTMWALTASKLERAARAQLGGSTRGSQGSSLRELVLLSNVWGSARPMWEDQEERERERERRERRKEEEERWLDGVLEEMLEEEELEGEEDFVSLRLVERGREQVGDSGFLEEQAEDEGHWKEQLQAIEEEENAELELELEEAEPSNYPLPPSPPFPPIALPISATRSSSQPLSTSPPTHLPALTPDSTPPSLASQHLLSTSADSVDSDLEDSYQWVQDRESGLGLRALDLSSSFSALGGGGGKKNGDLPPPPPLDLMTLSHTLQHHTHDLLFPFGPTLPPTTTTSSSLALTLSNPALALNWTPRPPRSISLPSSSLRSRSAGVGSRAPRFEFEGGLGRGFYDCVE